MKRRLTILMITGEYPPTVGGVGDYTRCLAQALIERGHRLVVLTGERQGAGLGEQGSEVPAPAVRQLSSDIDHANIDVLRFADGWGWRSWRPILQVIAQTQPDVVHLQYQTGAFAMRSAIDLLPWRLKRLPQRPRVVVTAHDLRLPYLFPKADRLRHWLTKRLLADADAVIVTNAEDAQRLAGNAPHSRELFSPRRPMRAPLHLIPIGSNIQPRPPADWRRESWRQQLGVDAHHVLIGYFGLLSRTKGARELLESLATLPPRYRLLLIGGAAPQPDDQRYAAAIERLIGEHGLRDRVRITGPVSETEVSAHLLAVDLVALPFLDGASYRRGSLLAALSHGCPTLTTAPAWPLDPPLIDGEHALVLPDAAPSTIRVAIERLAADESLRARLAAGARALAAHFAWPAIAARHETLYATMCVRDRGWVSGNRN